MIGELFNAMVDELVGDDTENRRTAALPYLAAKYNGCAQGLGAMLSPAAAPPPPALGL